MTSTAVAPPSPDAQPGPLATNGVDTPALLNRLQVVAVAVCVLFGVVAALVQVLSWQAEGRAAHNTEQVVRVQQIESQLLRADALATNGFLVGGIEPAAERTEYDQAISDVLSSIADAAEAQPADRTALAALNDQVGQYTTDIAQARANNRQQNPVGAGYLAVAGQVLRGDTGALAVLDNLVAADQRRSSDEFGGQHPYWLLGAGIVTLVVLWLVNRTIARRFHRHVNVGLAAAAVVVLVLTLVVGLHAGSRSRVNQEVRDGPYTQTIDEASARTAANDAKALESLRLINRGSGPTVEPQWQQQAAIVDQRASAATRPLWDAYVTAHQKLTGLDDAGSFFAAKALATTGVSSQPTTTELLDAFDKAAQSEVASTGATATDRLRTGGALAVILAILTLLGGLVAAGAATWGVNQRRREYS